MSAEDFLEVAESMKQEKLPGASAAPGGKPDWRGGAYSSPSAFAVSRPRTTTPKGKEPPKMDPANTPGRAKSVPPDAKNNSKVRRSLLLGRPTKSGEIAAGSHKCKEDAEENKVVAPGLGRGAGRAVVELFARPRRVRGGSGVVDEKKKCEELQEKVEASESVINRLQGEVLGLKEELEEAKRLNKELLLRNQELSEGLAVAEAKVVALRIPDQVRIPIFFSSVHVQGCPSDGDECFNLGERGRIRSVRQALSCFSLL